MFSLPARLKVVVRLGIEVSVTTISIRFCPMADQIERDAGLKVAKFFLTKWRVGFASARAVAEGETDLCLM